MIPHPFFYQLALIALVWLFLMLQYAWPSQRTPCQSPREQGDAEGHCKTPVAWPVLFICHSNPEKLPYACQSATRHV